MPHKTKPLLFEYPVAGAELLTACEVCGVDPDNVVVVKCDTEHTANLLGITIAPSVPFSRFYAVVGDDGPEQCRIVFYDGNKNMYTEIEHVTR